MAAQWELTSGPRGNGEREKEEGERASEKPNQQLLLIMVTHTLGKQTF